MSDEMTMEQLLSGCSNPYTREQFDADIVRLTIAIARKHNVPESYVPTLVRNHEYQHDAEGSEDDYLEAITIGQHMGWWS